MAKHHRAGLYAVTPLALAGVFGLAVSCWAAEGGTANSSVNSSGGIPAGQTGVGPKGTKVAPSTGNEATASNEGAGEMTPGKTGVGPRGTKVGPSTGNRATSTSQ